MSTAPQLITPPASPNKYGGDPVAFDAAMQAFLDWMATVAPQMNAQAAWLNQRADAVDAGAAAAGSIGASVSTAAASAAAAAVARDAALAAWVASTYPAETLASVSTALHAGAIVKQIVYDTSKDSDGGAWRKRTAHTSWYNETLGFTGKWLGQKTSTATAWATSGAAAGDGFQNSTDGKFYTLTGTNTASEIFRGNVREFPAVVAVVAESGRVVFYDLTQPTCPMWMVFVSGTNNWLRNSAGVTSVAVLNGTVAVGSSNVDLCVWNFVAESGLLYAATLNKLLGTMAQRNSSQGIAPITGSTIVNRTINDCAITVLDTAPIDAATGLPVPTIYAFTAGGVSRIAHDGTVSSTATGSTVNSGYVEGGYVYARCQNGAVAISYPVSNALPTGGASNLNNYWGGEQYYASSIPAMLGNAGSACAHNCNGTPSGLSVFKGNPSTPAKGMVDYITNTYNSGWMVGDIKGAWLADTTAETISGSGELVTNGDFASALTGWTVGGTASNTSVVAGEINIQPTADATSAPVIVSQANLATVVGRNYRLSYRARVAGSGAVGIRMSIGSANAANTTSTTNVEMSVDFVATSTTTAVQMIVYGTTSTIGIFDNISVKLAEPDRSVKNKGLVVNGSLTKTAVASGAGLVAYSGFSAANYLEQPYNADLDFGTGDFCVMGWVNAIAHSGSQTLVFRSSVPFSTNYIQLAKASDGTVYLATKGGTTERVTATSGLPIPTGAWCFIVATRVSGALSVYINAALSSTVSFAAEDVSSVGAVTRLGVATSTTPSALLNGSIALWRIGATAPSADQIAHIYRTELAMFQPGAQCTLAGSSAAVTTLAYDEDTTLLHVGTSWGRSSFKDLARIDSEATTTGALTSLSASGGVIVTGGTSGKVYMPALLLRDELRRKAEARKALGRLVVPQEFTATAGQTVFAVTKGYDVRYVYANGLLKRLGTHYTVSDDGFQKTVTFTSGQLVGVDVTLMITRS